MVFGQVTRRSRDIVPHSTPTIGIQGLLFENNSLSMARIQECNILHLYILLLYILLLFPLLVQPLEQEAVKVLDAFQKDCLDAHNTYRSQHGVPPLVWSEELTRHAQNWADELASRDEVKHDLVAINMHDEGENLAFFRPAVPKCQGSMEGNCVLCREMVKRWYDEAKNYDYDTGHSKTPEGITKHFSQVIWANTSEVGIGTAVSKKYGFITVARYRPRGNRGGPAVFVHNIPPEGGPLPSLFNDSPKVNPKSAASTTPTGNGIPVLEPHTNNKSQEGKGNPISAAPSSNEVVKTQALETKGSGTEGVSNTVGGSLDGSAIEKIKPKPLGQEINEEIDDKPPNKVPNLLSTIVDLAAKTKLVVDKQGVAETNQNRDGSQNLESILPAKAVQNRQEESNLDSHVNKDFSYENAESIHSEKASARDSIDGNSGKTEQDSLQETTVSTAGSNGGDHGNAVDTKSVQNENSKEMTGSIRKVQENKAGEVDRQNNGLNIHTDDGVIDGNNIQKDLKNRGLVRTVKGPDGSSAQVYLTKNGAHAGLVFRDQISRVSQDMKKEESLEFGRKRVINIL